MAFRFALVTRRRILSPIASLPRRPRFQHLTTVHIERVRVYDAFSAVVFKVRDDFTGLSDANESLFFNSDVQ